MQNSSENWKSTWHNCIMNKCQIFWSVLPCFGFRCYSLDIWGLRDIWCKHIWWHMARPFLTWQIPSSGKSKVIIFVTKILSNCLTWNRLIKGSYQDKIFAFMCMKIQLNYILYLCEFSSIYQSRNQESCYIFFVKCFISQKLCSFVEILTYTNKTIKLYKQKVNIIQHNSW